MWVPNARAAGPVNVAERRSGRRRVGGGGGREARLGAGAHRSAADGTLCEGELLQAGDGPPLPKPPNRCSARARVGGGRDFSRWTHSPRTHACVCALPAAQACPTQSGRVGAQVQSGCAGSAFVIAFGSGLRMSFDIVLALRWFGPRVGVRGEHCCVQGRSPFRTLVYPVPQVPAPSPPAAPAIASICSRLQPD